MAFKWGNASSVTDAIGQGGTDYYNTVTGDGGEKLGFGVNQKKKDANAAQQASQKDQQSKTQAVMGQQDKTATDYYNSMKGATDNYVNSYDSATGDYQKNLAATKDAYKTQATDSQAAYTNDVLPRLTSIMNQRQTNAGSAMSLADAQDPNNKVASATRDMYNTQAQGIQNQGLADYGVLAALGSQATGRTIGAQSGLMTGGQMQSLQNANMGQASGAFGNAQATANNMKLAGITAGQNQSNWAYGQGQQAINDYAGSVGQYQNANDQKNSIQNAYTNQEAGVDTNAYGVSLGQAGVHRDAATGLAGLQNANETASENRQQGFINGVSQTDQQTAYANAQAAAAAQAAKLGAIGTVGGAVIGGLASGGVGAAAGGVAGNKIASNGAGDAGAAAPSSFGAGATTANTAPASSFNMSGAVQGAGIGSQLGGYAAGAQAQPTYAPGPAYGNYNPVNPYAPTYANNPYAR